MSLFISFFLTVPIFLFLFSIHFFSLSCTSFPSPLLILHSFFSILIPSNPQSAMQQHSMCLFDFYFNFHLVSSFLLPFNRWNTSSVYFILCLIFSFALQLMEICDRRRRRKSSANHSGINAACVQWRVIWLSSVCSLFCPDSLSLSLYSHVFSFLPTTILSLLVFRKMNWKVNHFVQLFHHKKYSVFLRHQDFKKSHHCSGQNDLWSMWKSHISK